jgi:hypothetical protein
MSATNEQLQAAAEDLLESTLESPVEEYQERSRRARRPHAHLEAIQKVAMTAAGLASPRRGLNLARIDKPA